MKFLGLDAGSLCAKAMVMDGGALVAWRVIETTGKVSEEVRELVDMTKMARKMGGGS